MSDQDKLAALDKDFHDAANEIYKALIPVYKLDDGESVDACMGRAAVMARKLVAAEDAMQKLGEGYERLLQPAQARIG